MCFNKISVQVWWFQVASNNTESWEKLIVMFDDTRPGERPSETDRPGDLLSLQSDCPVTVSIWPGNTGAGIRTFVIGLMMIIMMQSVIFKLIQANSSVSWELRPGQRRRVEEGVEEGEGEGGGKWGVRREFCSRESLQPYSGTAPLGTNYILSLSLHCALLYQSELSRHIYIVNGKTDPTVSELHKYY